MSGGGDGDEGGPDVSQSAVNARLASFVAEHKAAQARGDPRAFRDSDVLLCALAEDALATQAEAQRKLAEVERVEFAMRGGRLQ